MAVSNYNCDVRQAFNFQKDAQTLIGHIDTLTIGTTQFTADLNVADPTNGQNKKVVGVISYIGWNGGYADPVSFNCQFSTENKKAAAILQHTDLSNTGVQVNFTVFDYDPKNKVYYTAFYTGGTALKGLVNKSGGELELQIDSDQSMEVVSPKNYSFGLGVMPTEEQQAIQLAVSNTDKFTKQWGVSVSA